MSRWQPKHHCKECRQRLFDVHPVEVKRAADVAALYSTELKNRKPEDKYSKPLQYEIREGYGWSNLARATSFEVVKQEGFNDKIPWHETWWQVSCILRDGYLPPGYILVPDKNLDEECIQDCYESEETVPDPDGNLTVVTREGSYRARRVVTKHPVVKHCYPCPRGKL